MHHVVLLLLCVVIDLIGLANVFWAEWVDFGWAPISAALLRWLFPEQIIFSVIQFAEEILPGTDLLPTATVGGFGRGRMPAYFYTQWRQRQTRARAERVRR